MAESTRQTKPTEKTTATRQTQSAVPGAMPELGFGPVVDSHPTTPDQVRYLQRYAGNHAVAHLLHRDAPLGRVVRRLVKHTTPLAIRDVDISPRTWR